MRLTRSGYAALTCLALTVVAEIATVVLSWGRAPWLDTSLFALYNVTLSAVGALIVLQLPRHPVGWILCLGGLQGALMADVALAWATRAVDESWPGAHLVLWIGLVSWCFGALMWVLVLLYTPTGSLLGRGWRIVLVTGLVGTGLYALGWWVSPASVDVVTGASNRYAIDRLPGEQAALAGGLLLSVAALGALVSLVARFHAGGAVVRQQLKWVALAGVCLVVLLPLAIVWWDSSPIVRIISPIVLVGCALAFGASVLRYRLFDVDRIIGRSVAYASVTVIAVAVYAASSVLLGTLAGRSWSSPWVVAVSTLVAAAVFRPVLRRVRQIVDRLFDRDALGARLRLDAFLEGLRSGTEQPDRLQQVLSEVLRDPRLRLLLYLPAYGGFVDVRGRSADLDPALGVVRLERQGVPEAVVQFTDDGEDARATRVRQLVEHARLAVQVARLGVELTRRLDELDLSRSRIAASADDERRRIQRDLHDGAQQRLVTVGIALRRLESRLRVAGRAPDADLIDGAVDDLATTIQELRNLTDALPPPQLDGGIGPALRELASRSPIPVVVDAGSERVGRTVETAAYFVACEGLTNVIKHAAASGATIRAMRHHGSLFVSVSDDGVGGATVRPGSGLAGLTDRVAAVGGSLRIDSDPHGTRLTAELPCD
ncbi:MAG TPA: histidine kinase [Microlunatus sp.]